MRVAVRLTPRSRADRIDGIVADEAGRSILKAAVTAVPEDGKANAALIALLAKTWRLPKSALAVATGSASRNKSVVVAGNPNELMKLLTDWARKFDG